MPSNCHRPAACASPVTAPLWLVRRAGENSALRFCENRLRVAGATSGRLSRAHKRRNLQATCRCHPYHRAGVHAIAIAAPRAAADAQHFGGQAIMVNAGTLKALERKGAAKKPTRLVVPQNSAPLQKNDGRRTALLGSIFKLEAHLGLVWCVQKVYFWMACSVFTKVSSQNHHTTPYRCGGRA